MIGKYPYTLKINLKIFFISRYQKKFILSYNTANSTHNVIINQNTLL
jgi:hypothetical protein